MGALLTVGGGAFLGFDAHRRLRRRARVLRQLAGALEQMDREIAFRLTPMPQLMEELAADYPPPVGRPWQTPRWIWRAGPPGFWTSWGRCWAGSRNPACVLPWPGRWRN